MNTTLLKKEETIMTNKTNGNNGNGNGTATLSKKQTLSHLRKRKWNLTFRTPNQEHFYSNISDSLITLCSGPAGTGKSYISVYYALKALAEKNNKIDGIILCRPLIPIDNESIGFLPGELDNKVDPYMMPYWQAIEKIVGPALLDGLIKSELVKVLPLAFFRGLTLENKIILYDEAQNSTPTAMKSFLTRIGDGSKMVILGDIDQTDRRASKNGLLDAIKKLENLQKISIFKFTHLDIVRHRLIGEILQRYSTVEKN